MIYFIVLILLLFLSFRYDINRKTKGRVFCGKRFTELLSILYDYRKKVDKEREKHYLESRPYLRKLRDNEY